jgi:chemotaxis protein methyltransferase CheR
MLQSRIQKRALELKFNSIHHYIEYLFSSIGMEKELDHFAAIVSTHKTEFFRENDHFTYLRTLVLPELLNNQHLAERETLVAWSSASSTGEEVYSIGMTMYDHLKKNGNFNPIMKVIGTDISDDIVNFARKGIYNDQSISTVPVEYRKYFMYSKDPRRHAIRVVPEIRFHTDFRRQNLMDNHYKVKGGIHVIFCRNVLIYFDKPTQKQILGRLVDLLFTGGFLFIGHSETLSGFDLPVEQVQLTIYRKTGA